MLLMMLVIVIIMVTKKSKNKREKLKKVLDKLAKSEGSKPPSLSKSKSYTK